MFGKRTAPSQSPYMKLLTRALSTSSSNGDADQGEHNLKSWGNGILLPKLFWPTVRKNCSSDREQLLKFEAEGREFAKFLRSLEQFIQTVKGQNNFW